MADQATHPIWDIERRWRLIGVRKREHNESNERLECTTRDLVRFRILVLHGPAGSGKSHEIARLRDFECAQGHACFIRFASVVNSRQDLHAALNDAMLRCGRAKGRAVYLDSLDEALSLQPLTTQWLLDWLHANADGSAGCTIRICSRSARWDVKLNDSLAQLAVDGDVGCMIAELRPLDEPMIRIAVSAAGLDPDAFITELESRRLRWMAETPLSLRLLLKAFAERGNLPQETKTIYEVALRRLAEETSERLKLQSGSSISVDKMLDAAERLACIAVMSGREDVDLSDSDSSDALSHRDLAILPAMSGRLDYPTLQCLAGSGLCTGTDDTRFRFMHRQVMEYLAGKRLATLLPHQVRSLLASDLGVAFGVASPLRETAHFAAMHNAELVRWLDVDDLIVLDMADPEERRARLLRIVEKFRTGQYTDSLLWDREMIPSSLKYDGAVEDVEPLLRLRGVDERHALACAIHIVESWQLAELSDRLAEVMLDEDAPKEAREAAGYALRSIGTPDAKARIKPLAFAKHGDEDRQLRGIAIQCNWPNNMSVTELFEALSRSRDDSFLGAYETVFFDLDRSGFDAAGHSAVALQWVISRWRRGIRGDSGRRLCQRIVHRALDSLDDPAVSAPLRSLLIRCVREYEDSPLASIETIGDRDDPSESPCSRDPQHRRRVIELLLSDPGDIVSGFAAADWIPGLANVEDFEWLLDVAVDESRMLSVRLFAAELIAHTEWFESAARVDRWLELRSKLPESSVLRCLLVSDLRDPHIQQRRKSYLEARGRERRYKAGHRLRPSAKTRVLRSLNSCESEDAKSFVQLCLDLTLKPDDTHYHFNACLVDTHGWMTATTNTRDRIVEAARQYLLVATDRADEAREDNPSQIVIGPMAALLLLYEQDVAWLRKRDGSWWMRWATLIVYDLNLYMSGERAETKHGLFALLHEQAAPVIRTRVLRIATIDGDPHRRLFEDMLEFYERIPDREFDDALATTIASGHVCADREFEAIAFLLKRKHAGIYDYSIDMMGGNLAVVRPSLRSSAMAATMLASLSRAIDRIIAFMQCEPSLARQGVERMASELRFRQARGEAEKMWNGVPSTKLGMAVEELIAIVPYREDRRGIRFMRMRGPEYAEDFRSDSVNALTKREDSAAVEALRRIERRYRDTLPWVSRLRAHAELAFGRDHWTPFLPTVVAEVLDAGDKRLIRSPEDVLEGIAAAIEHFQYQLQHHSLPKVEALWNLPSHRAPTPKKEEWASDCICDTIREYFNAHGVSVEREVQIRRRLVSRASGGRPGSKPDLFATLPARGPNGSQPIIVPIEVKRSDNPEAKAALRDQLAARYMTESGANAGAYIVVWFDAPDMGTHRPVWPSIEDARSDLEGQAKAVHAETGRTVRVLVVDASLH